MVYDKTKYPSLWAFTHNKGYGGGWDVPCRIVKRDPKRVQIAALKNDGTESLVWVRPDKLKEVQHGNGLDGREALV